MQKELDITRSRNALQEDFAEVIRLLEAGSFPVERAVSAVVPIEEAPTALAKWSNQPSSYTKIMVSM